jgi:hypothetical protein
MEGFEKSEGKIPFGRSWCRLEDGIKMDLKEIVWEVVDGVYLSQYRDKFWALVTW